MRALSAKKFQHYVQLDRTGREAVIVAKPGSYQALDLVKGNQASDAPVCLAPPHRSGQIHRYEPLGA